MTSAAAPAIGLHPELPGWTEQLAIAIAASADARIRIDEGDRIRVEDDSRERPYVRWAKLVIVLAASSCLASAGLFGAQRFLRHDSLPAPPPVQSPNAPAGIASANKGYRIATHPVVVRKADRAPTATVPAAAKPRAPTRIAHAKPARAVPPAPSANNLASAYAPPAPPPAAGAAAPPMEARLTPVPETRPTTIDGWMLREVVNGTAVLEGPDGVWRAKRGDTVPGVGEVVDIFGWGNRMIVATSRGLISTP
jgi:hypothetical protein